MRRLKLLAFWFCFTGFLMTQATDLNGQDDFQAPQPTAKDAKTYLNLPLKTLGGKQFWTDFGWAAGWRLQQHAVTGHWRVLDDKNVRRAWGDRAACENIFFARRDQEETPAKHVVVLVHGLLRSSGSMTGLAKVINQETGLQTVRFDYASTRKGINEHAAALRNMLETLPGSPQIDFVCHSMGNIVVRHMIGDLQREQDPGKLLPRLRRMVMLGPPNQGADIAKQLSRLGLFEIVTGQGGMELGPAWDEFKDHLATPPFPFLIVAGDTGNGWMKNPALTGPSDLLVRVDEAKLEGCQQFHILPVMHSLLMSDKNVQQIVLNFLKE